MYVYIQKKYLHVYCIIHSRKCVRIKSPSQSNICTHTHSVVVINFDTCSDVYIALNFAVENVHVLVSLYFTISSKRERKAIKTHM